VLLGRFRRVWSGVALINIAQFHRMASDLLRRFGQRGNLVAVAFVGCGDRQGEQVAQRIDRDVDPLPPLGPIVTSPYAGLRRGLQSAAI
jgi:hypothetical protein